MRSAEECGLDSRNLRSLQDITKPSLFPDIKLHSSGNNSALRLLEIQEEEKRIKLEEIAAGNGNAASLPDADPKAQLDTKAKLSGVKRSAQTLFLMTKGREIQQRIQSSVFYVKPTKDVPDVVRYVDKSMSAPPRIDVSAVLSNCLRGRKKTKLGLYVPAELVTGQYQESARDGKDKSGATVNLADLEAKERYRKRFGSQDDGEQEGGAAQGEDYDVADEGEEDEGEDYVKDHYESDDMDGGDEGEATF